MASVSYHIANLLEKMTSNDKDFRFMATNDLMTELQKDSIKLDDDSERKNMGRKRGTSARSKAEQRKLKMRERRAATAHDSTLPIEFNGLGEPSPFEGKSPNALRLATPQGSLSTPGWGVPPRSDSPTCVCTPPSVPPPLCGAGQTNPTDSGSVCTSAKVPLPACNAVGLQCEKVARIKETYETQNEIQNRTFINSINEHNETEQNKIVNIPSPVQGHFDQSHPRFGDYAGKQCVMNSLSALIYSQEKPTTSWTESDLDQILTYGNEMYKFMQQSSTMHYDLIAIHEIPRSIEYKGKMYNFAFQETLMGTLGDSQRNLDELQFFTLYESLHMSLLQNSDGIFVTFKGNTFVVIKQNNLFCVSDSHSRSTRGFLDPNGFSTAIHYESIEDVYHHCLLLAESMAYQANDVFEVTAVEILEDIHTIHKMELAPNKNSDERHIDENMQGTSKSIAQHLIKDDSLIVSSVEQEKFYFQSLSTSYKRKLCKKLDMVCHMNILIEDSEREGSVDLDEPIKMKRIQMDGNCFFRAVSWSIASSENYHNQIRKAVVKFMLDHPQMVLHLFETELSVVDYINASNMISNGTWATDIEIHATAVFLGIDVYTFSGSRWLKFNANNALHRSGSIYLNHTNTNHYDVVIAVGSSKPVAPNNVGKESQQKNEYDFFLLNKYLKDQSKKALQNQHNKTSELKEKSRTEYMRRYMSFQRKGAHKDRLQDIDLKSKRKARQKDPQKSRAVDLKSKVKARKMDTEKDKAIKRKARNMDPEKSKSTDLKSKRKAREIDTEKDRAIKRKARNIDPEKSKFIDLKSKRKAREIDTEKDRAIKRKARNMDPEKFKSIELKSKRKAREIDTEKDRAIKRKARNIDPEKSKSIDLKSKRKAREIDTEKDRAIKRKARNMDPEKFKSIDVKSKRKSRELDTEKDKAIKRKAREMDPDKCKAADTRSKRKRRLDIDIQQKESETDRRRKRIKRSDDKYLEEERIMAQQRRKQTGKKERVHDQWRKRNKRKLAELSVLERKGRRFGQDVFDCLKKFREKTSIGPVYVCTCCQQTWFRQSVVQCHLAASFKTYLTGYKSVDGLEWICHTCLASLRNGKIPKLSVANGMNWPRKPEELNLHQLEERLIALRIPFMQIRELPRGGQYSMKGNVVNVPVDIQPTLNALPRPIDENFTIAVKLKKKLAYKSCDFSENVRPSVLITALHWLMSNSELYKNSGLKIDDQWLEETTKSADDIVQEFIGKQTNQNGEYSNVNSANEDDGFCELNEDECIQGNSDTLIGEADLDTNKVLVFAPAEGQKPVSLYQDEDAEYLSFPTIFCGQRRIENNKRQVPVSYSDIAKWELRSADRRAANSVPDIFFKLNKIQHKQVSDKVNLAVRRKKNQGKKITAGEARKQEVADEIVSLNEGYYIFRTLRNSPAYLESRKKDVFAMIRQLGLPTWFMSISAADTRWPELLKTLSQLDGKILTDEDVENLDWNTKTRLIKNDPATCSRFFDHRARAFINTVLKSDYSPLGILDDSFDRTEFQNRGSPHIHMLIWTEDGPKASETEENITNYVDEHITCSLDNLDEELRELVQMQIHKHSKTCKKKGKSVCRFGFPLPPLPKTMLLQPLEVDVDEFKEKHNEIQQKMNEYKDGCNMTYEEFLKDVVQMDEDEYIKCIRSSLKGPKVFLKRKPAEMRVNYYNETVLRAWRANIDIQYVLDPYACAMYIVSYISKAQRGMSAMLEQASKEASDGNLDLKRQVRHIGNKFLNFVEICAQEACYLVLQMPLTRASRDVVFINTSLPDERVFLLKTKEQLENLPEDSTDIESNNVIKRYSKRPRQLERYCLADYVSELEVIYPNDSDQFELEINDDDVDEGDNLHDNEAFDDSDVVMELRNGIIIRRRKKSKVIRYVKYSKRTNTENYYREKLMLFMPWRNEDIDILGGFQTYEEHFENRKIEIELKMKKYEHNVDALDMAIQQAEEDNMEQFDELAPNTEQMQADDALLPSTVSEEFIHYQPDTEAHMSVDIGQDLGLTQASCSVESTATKISEDDYLQLVRSLNTKQREFFNHVVHWFKTKEEPLYAFLSGGAGVGKSVVIRALYQALHRLFNSEEGENPDDVRILLCAFTGKAAYNINGLTIASAFHRKMFQTQQHMQSDELNTFRTMYRNLKVVIIDEISMVGNNMLSFIHERLTELTGTKGDFGGISIIAVGDLYQLPPVADRWIFKDLSIGLARNLWKDHFSIFELTQIMRQKDDLEFAEMLNRLRLNKLTEKDKDIISHHTVEHASCPQDALHLFTENKRVHQYNDKLIQEIDAEKVTVNADTDIIAPKISQDMKSILVEEMDKKDKHTLTANLMSSLQIAVGMTYDISVNVDVQDGLTNGTTCKVKYIEFKQSPLRPAIIWVLFSDENVGTKRRNQYRNLYHQGIDRPWTPIFEVKRSFLYNKKTYERIQFPLLPSAAKTVHKAQGSTVDHLVVDLKSSFRTPHIHYVAISRVRTLKNLHILDFNEKSLSVDDSVHKEMERLRQNPLQLCYIPLYTTGNDDIKVLFNNARSLHKHFPDVKSEPNVCIADLVGFAETRLTARDDQTKYNIPGFTPIRSDEQNSSSSRPVHGLIIYVVRMLLKLLEDKNGEVQNLAVKCLGPLVNKVKEFQVETIVDTLCSNMLSDKEQLRDISSIGLKTVISELPPSSTALAVSICKKITGRLTSAISKQEDMSVQLEALDILGDLLSRFGGLLISFHSSIMQALLPQLSSPRLAVRKRAIIAIGYLVMSCNNTLFMELIDFLLSELNKNSSTSTTRTYIQCVGAISRQAGHRFGEYMEKMVPPIVKFCKEEDDELREYCLQAFESFVRRCPKEISPFVPEIVKICLRYICHDPNYNYDEDEEDDSMETEDDEDEEEDEDEYSDDDDMSWKVRRAAAKCLDAIIGTRHEMLMDFYKHVSPALIARFKEREENVKADIFHAYITLLRQTRPSLTGDPDAMEQDGGPVSMLQNQITDIVKAIHKQLREKSVKTRQGCFSLLTELVLVLPGALSEHFQQLVPGIQYSLGDKNSSSNMKIDTLAFLNCVLTHHSPTVFHPHVKVMVPPIVHSVSDPFYKITSEALLVTQQLVKVVRPLDVKVNFDYKPYVRDLYTCTLSRLKAADIDQEVKERAISCMGQIIRNLGDSLSAELKECLPIFLERLKNEITRLTAVKALTMIAGSPLKIDLRTILDEGIPVLASFLRKNQRALKLSTLSCLDVLVKNYGSALTSSMIHEMMKEMPPLINENDLHVSQLTLNLLTSISKIHKSCMATIPNDILPQILLLILSPLLQGGALNALLEFFQSLVSIGLPKLGFRDLLQMLITPVYSPHPSPGSPFAVHRQAFHSIAKCVAALTVKCPNEASNVVNQFVSDVRNSKSTDSIKLFSLLALGEIGKHIDLSSHGEIQTVILESFSSQNEEVKAAASYALGNVSVGNLPKFLPFVLKEIENQPKRQYLLLHSLKEIISCESASAQGVSNLKPYVQTVWSMLFNHCECPEEGTRNVVSECLGKLTLIDPPNLLTNLKQHLSSQSPLTRSTVVTAIKFTISDQPQGIDSLLRSCIGDFLSSLQDPDLNVRRVALVTFNSAAHNKPTLIRDLLDGVLPHLYNETKVRKELIREVEMGPFKHTLDDGLDIRKAAFECMYTLLDSCLDRLDIFEFLNHVEDGLKDHYDIKMLTYLMLVRLSHLCPSAMLQRLDRLVEPLRATCTTKVKAHSVKQEFEKQDELKRSAMRAVASLLSITDADKSPQMNEFLSQIKSSAELGAMFETIQKDAQSSSSTDIMVMDTS